MLPRTLYRVSVTVRLPGSLRELVGGESKLSANGLTLGEIFSDIEKRYPGFRSRLIDERGRLVTYVNVYIGEHDARTTGGLTAEVPDGSLVMVIPAMAGGR